MKLFGWSIKRQDNDDSDNKQQFAPPTTDDGAVQLVDSGIRNTFLDIDGSIKTEAELITRYRELSLQPEINSAIDDIINECVAYDEKADLVALNLDMLPGQYNDRIKDLISEEFKTIVKLYDFNNSAYEILRRWYIDGRMYYYALIDKKHPEAGIQELRYIDPRQMRKVRVVKQEVSKDGTQQTLVKKVQEYFLYSEKGFAVKPASVTGYQNNKSIKISKDAIVHATSGLMDPTNTTVLSYLHKASKPLNQLRAIEDASVINRLVRAPLRRVFTVEVGSLPKAKGEQYLRDQMVKYKNKLTYDSCVDMNTVVPLLDGRHLTITQISDEIKTGKQLWTYSCDRVTGEIVPGLISRAGVNRKNAEVMKITFDNGKELICTPDHEFPVREGVVKRADQLFVGQSMMPFYTQKKTINNQEPIGNQAAYEQIFDNGSGKWIWTHKMVSNWKDDNGINNEWIYDETRLEETDRVIIHHRNFNPLNNDPENVVKMKNKDHICYHQTHAVELAKKKAQQGIPYFNMTHEEHVALGKKYGSAGGKASVAKAKKNGTFLHHLKKMSAVRWGKYYNDEEFRADITEKSKKAWTPERRNDLSARMKKQQAKMSPEEKHEHAMKAAHARWPQYYNHKIVKIERLDETMDVGCITVDANEQYHSHHTFATDCGVFICNSTGTIKDNRHFLTMLEDFWFPSRQGNQTTRVENLQGAADWHDLDDLTYFREQLLNALNVPVSRLQPGAPFNIGRPSEITRDELKFAKFIARLRLRFSIIFKSALTKQLILKRILTEDECKEVMSLIAFDYKRDNFFSELKDAEILQNRVGTLNLVQPFVGTYYSMAWVRKNVLHMDEEEIKQQEKEMASEPPPLQLDQMMGAPPQQVPDQNQQQPPPKTK